MAVIDAGTFGVATVCLAALRVAEPKPERSRGTAAPDGAEGAPAKGGTFTAGFRFILGDPVLRSITLALGLALLAFGFTAVAVASLLGTPGVRRREVGTMETTVPEVTVAPET